MVIVTAHARLKPGARETAVAAALRMREASLAEDGCQEYGFWFAIDDPDLLLVYERWDDQAALDFHFTTPHLAEFAASIPEWIDGMPEITRIEVASAGPMGA
jgi:quinol monooxygenase YgiN